MKKRLSVGGITMSEIARLAGVSKSTVSLALGGSAKISERTRAKIREIARGLKFRKNESLGRVMSGVRRSDLRGDFENIALVRVNGADGHRAIDEYIGGVRRRAAAQSCSVVPIVLNAAGFDEHKFAAQLRTFNVRGCIVVGHYRRRLICPKFAEVLKRYNTVSAGIKSPACSMSVVLDRFLFAFGMTRRIVECGHSRVGFVIEEFADRSEDFKLSGGFMRALPPECAIPPLYWRRDAKANKTALLRYVKKYSLSAVFSYSTAVSREIVKSAMLDGKRVALFHGDDVLFGNPFGLGVSNRGDVGELAVDLLLNSLGSSGLCKRGLEAVGITPRFKLGGR